MSWFAIVLDEIRTRWILREKADCKQSMATPKSTRVHHFLINFILLPMTASSRTTSCTSQEIVRVTQTQTQFLRGLFRKNSMCRRRGAEEDRGALRY